MVTNELLRELDGSALEENVTNPLMVALTVMNKFSVLPIYFVQFLITKGNYLPKIIVTSYDNRDVLLSASNSDDHMHTVIYEKTPKTVTPTAVVYPQEINYKDVMYNTSEDYYYSSSYLVSGKELKNYLAKKIVELTKIRILSDTYRKTVRVSIGWKFNPDEVNEQELGLMFYPIPETISNIKLPLSNYTKLVPSFSEIINKLTGIPDVTYDSKNKEDSIIINSLVTDVKDQQMINIGNTDIKIFKDFIKQKPSNVRVWSCDTADNKVKDVALEMGFNNKHNAMIIYRYLNNVVDSLNPNEIEE